MENPTFEQHVLTPEYLENPYRFYNQLRSEDPVYWSEALRAWLLTRYDDVVAGLRDTRLSSGTRVRTYIKQLPQNEQSELQPLGDHISTWVGFIDPPDHTRLRALISKAFTSSMVDGLRPRVQALTDELLDAVHRDGQMDIVSDLAFPLPATVICEMLGLPTEGRAQFTEASNQLVEFMGTGRPRLDFGKRTQQSVFALKDYLDVIFAERRRDPKEDLISSLVAVEEEGDKLNADELFGMCVQLLMAGHETTRGLIANGILALLRNPDQMSMLRSDPALIVTAVEELLRYDSPVQHQTRVANQDFKLDGKRIREGQRVLLLLGAANRDPARFDDPDRLDISRQPNRHVGFGYGAHFCIGAPLARLEGQIAINTILRKMVGLRLADDHLTWRRNTSLRNPNSVPARFEAA